MLRPEDQFHVGIVAEDFEATQAQLSSLFGFEWTQAMGAATEVELPTGAAVIDFACVYSRTSPRVEIVRKVPGTLWEPTPGSGIHHFGYWSDDVSADTAELERHGWVIEATRKGPDGALFFAFLRSARGFRVELVDRKARPSLERIWA
ncbi:MULTISPECIES: VOC family protein [unclassified Streptomyces]|uniref:VOC family protein n=1 Tax=unclassified Streptomyces TaxID=2593676 RepID=UPI0023651AB2|nr:MULTISPECIES: VOC family protein [unclassified Streptomyces]MDF3142823.1 VOC family protein [Streptomyces sp. T21Q-yed]WDF42347.1 VOC family protein [Streptomyces sp. T12]